MAHRPRCEILRRGNSYLICQTILTKSPVKQGILWYNFKVKNLDYRSNLQSTPVSSQEKVEGSVESKYNEVTKRILKIDLSTISPGEYMDLVENEMGSNNPVLYESEIKELYDYYIRQCENPANKKGLVFEFGRRLMDYTSEFKIEDGKTQERTLDRSYKIFFEEMEKHPEEMYNLYSMTHHMFEFVKPEVFFETYLKIKNSPVLDKYDGGHQFSQLEYNLSYCDAEKYIKALLDKINFKNSSSCLESSRLINLSASLANYAKSGSYSGSYDVDGKIINGLKSQMDDPNSIYLLGSKSRFIVSRLENGYHPFVHRNQIFNIAPGMLACMSKDGMSVVKNNPEVERVYDKYLSITKEMDTPPKHLVDAAVAKGQDFVEWTQDPSLRIMRGVLVKDLQSKMSLMKPDILNKNFGDNQSQLQEFINLIGTDYRDFLEEEFGVDLSKLSIPEQFYFLELIQKRTNETIKLVKKFSEKFKEKGLRTFFSMEHGGKEMGDKILTLGEKLPKESAEKLFSKYGEIIDEVENIAEYLSKSIGEKATPEILESAQNHLLIKGRDLLSSYAKNADTCKDEECEDLGRELESKLANIKSSLLLFASACKSLSEQKLLSIEDLANTDLDVIHGGLEEEAQEEMMRIFKENRPHYPPELLADTISEFESALQNKNENQTWYVLRNGGDIASFMRLDNLEDGSIYGASFNVRTELRGSTIGSELLKKIIEEKSEKQPFKIVCYDKNPMLKKYIEDFKFKVIGTIENYHNTGEKFYDMVREPQAK